MDRQKYNRRPLLETTHAEINRLYWEEELSERDIAVRLDVSMTSVNRYLLKKRNSSEAQHIRYKYKPPIVPKGRIDLKSGYVLAYKPGYYKPVNKRYAYEHRLVWEEQHQQRLPDKWMVHHINGIRNDNRPENLVAMPRGKHGEVIPKMAMRIRVLEIENRQLRRSLEDSQMILYIGDN